jgi:hypothetical protein
MAHRLLSARPRIAAEIVRPHAEEALVAGVVGDLLEADALTLLGEALGAHGHVERVVLWGADIQRDTEDMSLAGSLREVFPDAGRASVLEAEPDLVVITEREVVAVDATVGRPGHAAARALRGEPVPQARLDDVRRALEAHGFTMAESAVPRHYAAARLAAITLSLAQRVGRAPVGIALAGPNADLLHPSRDPLADWAASAAAVLATAAEPGGLALHCLTWLRVAARLEPFADAETAVRRIRLHPLLAPSRGQLG